MSRLGINLLSICAARLEINYVSVLLLLLLLLILLDAGFVVFCVLGTVIISTYNQHMISTYLLFVMCACPRDHACMRTTDREQDGRPSS